MSAVMLKVTASFSGEFLENSLFISTDIFENFLVCRDYCVAPHNPACCSLINCQFQIHLSADEDWNDLIRELERLCFTDQHVYCF